MTFVLDNSVALTWCFEDERTPATEALLIRVTDEGAFAPVLWPLEAVNGLLAAERRGRLHARRRERLVRFLHALPITIDTATANRAWDETMRLANWSGLTAYDAAYLELALRLNLPLASLDRQLRSAATRHRVDLLGT